MKQETQTTPKIYSVAENAKGFEFVNGNTKHLAEMNQKDLKVLFDNGDPRIIEKEESSTVAIPEEKKPSRPAPATLPA
ncbi:hypothetical protein [Dyadobacter diqingensis]|uniref:hypothetical protein n=1 Tax=Dyadobacter diqingensis TaxID=2938121 RepID=UPI0020C54E1E|nr:hypothetical protein [Dyadobacter diqingensis]